MAILERLVEVVVGCLLADVTLVAGAANAGDQSVDRIPGSSEYSSPFPHDKVHTSY